MTIRKQLITIISLIILLVILIYSIISTGYVIKYFNSFVVSEYEQNVERIKEQAINILINNESESSSTKTMSVFLSSLIEEISILDIDGKVVVDAKDDIPMMHGIMMGRQKEESDYFDLIHNGQKIGTLIIGRSSAIHNSESMVLFGKALTTGAMISGAISIVAALIIISFVSSKITKDLRLTAAKASIADNESFKGQKYSKIAEIRSLQQSLENLSAKLGLQKGLRKEKADQISHEVRTPLSILKSNIEGARDKVIKMDDSRLESCLIEIDHLSDILSTISDIVDYDKEEIVVQKKEFDIVTLISSINKGFKTQFENKNIILSYKGENKLYISSDKSLLSQSIYNLISNAYKFTPSNGKVVVSLDDIQGFISISVSDSGPGVKDEDKARIFKAYQRGSNAHETPGDGLGLFITKKNVEALGGTLLLKKSSLGGECFIISIPK